ncbi:MAG: hypothetical protein ACC700_18990 [Anaerolineales bacterium]
MKALLGRRLPRGILLGGILIFGFVLAGCIVLPPNFTYQGRLLNSSGAPVPDANYTFDFGLWDASSAGTKVCTDAGNTVSVTDGLFDAAVEGCDVEVYRSPLWLEVTVGGETLSPRQKLRGAPYANSLSGGAVVQAYEPINRTLDGNADTGAGLAVFNSDSTAVGGHGLLVGNAAVMGTTGAYTRGDSAALAAQATGDGYGATFESLNYRGMYAKGASTWFAAVFDSTIGIQLIGGGSCSGCRTAYVAKNVGETAILPGDLVEAAGVTVDPDLDMPVMLVQKAKSADAPFVGVAEQAMTRTEVGRRYGWTTGGYDASTGKIASGDYLSVVVDGLVQARVSELSPVSIGDRAAIASDGGIGAGSLESSLGLVMSAPGSDGLVWILLGGG